MLVYGHPLTIPVHQNKHRVAKTSEHHTAAPLSTATTQSQPAPVVNYFHTHPDEPFSHGPFIRQYGVPHNISVRFIDQIQFFTSIRTITRDCLHSLLSAILKCESALSIKVNGKNLNDLTSTCLEGALEIIATPLLIGGKKKQMQTIVVTTVAKPQKKKEVKKRKKATSVVSTRITKQTRGPSRTNLRSSSVSAGTAVARNFLRQIQNPFTLGVGGHVPYGFRGPTVPYHLKQQFIVNSTPGGTAGFIIHPNPILSTVDITNLTNGVQCLANASQNQFTENPFAYGATTPSELFDLGCQFQVVSIGVLIENAQAELSCQGNWIIANSPMGSYTPGFYILENEAATPVYFSQICYGMNTNSLNQNLLDLPCAFEVPATTLLRKSLEHTLPVYDPAIFYKFRSMFNNAYNSISTVADEVDFNTAGGGINVGDSKALTSCEGAGALFVYGSGLPHTGDNAVLRVTVIYNLQIAPQLGTGTAGGTRPVPTVQEPREKGFFSDVEWATVKSVGYNAFKMVGSMMDIIGNRPAGAIPRFLLDS